MEIKENQVIEFKREYTQDVKKEVIAFINSEGGDLYIGIDDSGKVIGVNDIDDTMLKITNSLKEGIIPDVMPFINVDVIRIESKDVILVKVNPGTNKPYYLKDKGLRPEGVYVRKGSSCQPLSFDAIKDMIKRFNNKSYEESRSMNQNLSFETLTREMNKRDLKIETTQMKNLKLIGDDGLYTNLAYILSDEFNIPTKVAIFQGTEKTIFKSRKEIGGSILKQLDDTYEYLDIYNQTAASFKGLDRQDYRDYPQEAIREVLLNMFVHRDYSLSSSNIINVYEDKMEFISVGGLNQNIELKSIFLGVSLTSNPNLANLFYRMKLIESYGLGIQKIMASYEGTNKEPLFETARGVFKVTLFNRNYKTLNDTKKRNSTTEGHEEEILNYLNENKYITRKYAQELLGISQTQTYTVLSKMCEARKIKQVKEGKLTRYTLIS